MSFVSNPIMRRIQLIVASHLFDYFGDFVAAVNVLFVSVSTLRHHKYCFNERFWNWKDFGWKQAEMLIGNFKNYP